MREDERDRLLHQKLEALILARLSVSGQRPPSSAQVSKTLGAMLARRFTAAEWRQHYEMALDSLAAAGLITTRPLALTSAGQARLGGALGLGSVPRSASWKEFRAKYLPRLFSPAARASGKAVDPRLIVLAERLGVPVPVQRQSAAAIDRHELDRLLEAWLVKDWGLSGRLELDNLLAALLGHELGLRPKQKLSAVLRQGVTRLSGATKDTKDAVTDALTTRWVLGQGTRPAGNGNASDRAEPGGSGARERLSDASARPPVAALDAAFLERAAAKVTRVAAGPSVRPFGPNKVFIASVWESLAADPELHPLGEAGFKSLLIEAHRRGLLALSRADLIAAMDPRDVAASETRHRNATYHFIVRGAPA